MIKRHLLDKSCRPVSAAEDRRTRKERMSEHPVYLESTLSLPVQENIAIEEEEMASDLRAQLSTAGSQFLWLSEFIVCYIFETNF